MNYAWFAAEQAAGQPEVLGDIQQIQAAAERAARLTSQLLIFARREPAQPQPLDLNAVMDDIQNLLSRSIGAHIGLSVDPAAGLPAIEADRGQMEQVLLNLAINARDAMPGGGILTIRTGLAELDQAYADSHPGASPGRYVQLTVADRITELNPGVPVLYMTGYAAAAPAPSPGSSEQAGRIQKPFAPQTLLQAIRQALETT
jgi:two-component system cell cycle sensor histidine kinase/response regulator CckA